MVKRILVFLMFVYTIVCGDKKLRFLNDPVSDPAECCTYLHAISCDSIPPNEYGWCIAQLNGEDYPGMCVPQNCPAEVNPNCAGEPLNPDGTCYW